MHKNVLYYLLGLTLFLYSCAGPSRESDKLLIVTTTGIIANCIEEIVGDQAEVVAIMGPGVDPHLYKASQGDLSKLSKADIIVYNGLHLEGKMAEVLEKLGKSKMSLAVGSFAADDQLKRVDNESNLRDPHIWFDPDLWMACMQGVTTKLEEHEALNGLQQNYDRFLSEVQVAMEQLHQELDSNLSSEQRVLITSHDAFSYFGNAFGFQVRGLQGISTAAEFGVKDVADLIDFIVEHKVKSVFIETSVSDKNLRSVIEGARARGFSLRVGGTLYSDALGEKGEQGGSYIGMIQSNVQKIINGLKHG